MPTIDLDNKHPVALVPSTGTAGSNLIVKNIAASGVAYYSEEASVSSTNHTGELAVNGEVTLTNRSPVYFIGSEAGVILRTTPSSENVTGPEIDKEAVTAEKIAAGAVTEPKLGPESVASAKIKKEAVTEAKIGPEAVAEAGIKTEAVSAGKIATGAVTATKLGAESVETAKIKVGAVTEGTIGAEAVSTAKIKLLAVENGQLGAEAVSEGKLKNEAVSAAKLKTESVETAKIKNLAVTNGKIEKETITGEKLVNNTITGKQLAVGIPEALKELKENTSIENSATNATTVYVNLLLKLEKTAYEIIADGVAIYKYREDLVVAASQNQNYEFRIKAGAKWEVKTTVGKIETSTTTASVYSFQTG